MPGWLKKIALFFKRSVICRYALICLFLCFFSNIGDAHAGINSMRIGQGVGNVRLVFDSDQSFDYKVFLLGDPKRLIIDTQNVRVNPKIVNNLDSNNFVSDPQWSLSNAKRRFFDDG